MDTEVDPHLQRLIEAHPLLFRGRAPAISSYVSPGWYELLDKLCRDIEVVLGPLACAGFEVRQIKEKFGSLRFYYAVAKRSALHVDVLSEAGHTHFAQRSGVQGNGQEGTETQVGELVAAACTASETTCQTCGERAELRNVGGYLTTVCDRHLAEMRSKPAQS